MRRKLSDNLRHVRDRIAAACAKAGRDPNDVTLIAVTKTVEVDVIRSALELGLTDFGESRVQELTKRAGMIEEYRSRRLLVAGSAQAPPSPNWHMIGSLQRNKVKAVLPWARTIHSVDSLRLAEDISAHSAKMNRTTNILVQINVSEERTKHGVAVAAAGYLIDHIREMTNVAIIGLMTMAPLTDNPENARPHFARLHEVFQEIKSERGLGPDFAHLSMGMSGDFEVAIQEGATMVRIGTALFEGVTAAS
jgi:pyridoxal phosphate enzyme (YggS family)